MGKEASSPPEEDRFLNVAIMGVGLSLVTLTICSVCIGRDFLLFNADIERQIEESQLLTKDAWKVVKNIHEEARGSGIRHRRYAEDPYGAVTENPYGGSSRGGNAPSAKPRGSSEHPYGSGRTNEKKEGGCDCKALARSCPRGPPGAPGAPGEAGEPGDDGVPGRKGENAKRPPAMQKQFKCAMCPAGPPGRPGMKGMTGPKGRSGTPGAKGANGKDTVGKDGEPGDQGAPGNPGSDGAPGPAGQDSMVGKRLPGPPGPLGLSGDAGPKGADGDAGENGKPGFNGMPGFPGEDGQDGETGSPGPAGPPGGPGDDGGYCPCPAREKNIISPEEPPYTPPTAPPATLDPSLYGVTTKPITQTPNGGSPYAPEDYAYVPKPVPTAGYRAKAKLH